MSLEEKIGQMVQLSGEFFNNDDNVVTGPRKKLGISKKQVFLAGSVLNVVGAKKTHQLQEEYLKHSPHKIPLLFMSDIIYGLKTVYPIPLGMGATWNPSLIEKAYQNTAAEAYASGNQVSFAPMVDLVHDARWGRVLESTGEDPYLNSLFAASMVKGFQKDLGKNRGIASCIKHFAAYGAVESGREYNSVDMSERRLKQEYLPSYKAAVDAGVEMVMASFNTLNGIPATGNKWLLKNILREEWGFNGILISDYAAINELVAHGFAESQQQAAKLAVEATVDIDMQSSAYVNELKSLIENGLLNVEKINDAVWRVLLLKNKLGLFEDPYRGANEKIEEKSLLTPKKRQLAREVADKAIVLLKNKDDLLPLNKHSSVALIGPYADEHELLGLWAVHGDRKESVTINQAFSEVIESKHLSVAKGTNILDDRTMLKGFGLSDESIDKMLLTDTQKETEHEKAISAAKKSDVVVMAVGEHTLESGEAGSRTDITLPYQQKQLIHDIANLGKKIVLVLISGRPLVLTDVINDVDAVIEAWFPGTEGGHAIADVVFGDVNPSGRLSMTFPYNVGQEPIYYNELSTGRSVKTSKHSSRFMSRYIDAPVTPLFPFGYGLSYHRAIYSNLNVNKNKFSSDESIKATVDIENNSYYSGIETVQLYIQDMFASVVQPEKNLKAFQQIYLSAHEKRRVTFTINVEMLKFYNTNLDYIAEPGDFKLYIGKNSQDVLETNFTLLG